MAGVTPWLIGMLAEMRASLLFLACALSVPISVNSEPRLELYGKENGQIGDYFHIKAIDMDVEKAKITICQTHDLCAWAEYQVVNGQVDVSVVAPLDGTYSGVDEAGLLWSADESSYHELSNDIVHRISHYIDDKRYSVLGFLETSDGLVDEVVLYPSSYVKSMVIDAHVEHDFIEKAVKIFFPPQPGRYPAVIFFDGQPPDRDNILYKSIALSGYIVVYMDYWRDSEGNTDRCLSNVDLFNYYQALDLIKNDVFKKELLSLDNFSGYEIDGDTFHLVGGSRGAEAARWMNNAAPELFSTMTLVSGTAYGLYGCNEGDVPWLFKGKELPSIPLIFDVFDKISWTEVQGTQKDSIEEYVRAVSNSLDLNDYWIPEDCGIPVNIQYGKNDEKINGSELSEKYKNFCENRSNNISVSSYKSGHHVLGVPWVAIDCDSFLNENRSSVSCSDYVRGMQSAFSDFIAFIRRNPVTEVDPLRVKLGQCRRSHDSLMDGIRECLLEPSP